jgi:phage terminase large subunit-like protein
MSKKHSSRGKKVLDKWSPENFNTLPGYNAIATRGDAVWNPDSAKHPIEFIENLCTFAKGTWTGNKFVLLPWQKSFIANLYGWIRPNGTRRYREAGIWVPRKNGKTEMLAPLGLYHLLADDEPTPEVVSFAADRKQAKLVFDRARTMIRAETEFESRCEVYQNRIVSPHNGGVWAAMSSDAPTAHGMHVSFAIGDEIHAMANRRELWEAIQTSQGARLQPLMISITTAGTLRESLEWDQYEYACKIRDQIIDNPAYLPCIYETPETMDWKTPEAWNISNPSLGVSLQTNWLHEECKRAQEQPSFETPFRCLHLNQHVTADVRWVRMSDWDKCASEIDESKLCGLPCYLGIDLGEVSDLTSLTAVWLDGDEYHVRSWSYAPEEGAERRQRRDRVPYLDWARQKWLTLTPGDATDYEFLRAEIHRITKEHRVVSIGYDPNNAGGISQQLIGDGLNLLRVPQSFMAMSGPTRRWEAAVVGQKIFHNSNPVLTWAMSNCVVELDYANNPRPSKRRSVEKIDPVIAGIIALGVALNAPPTLRSPYEDHGIQWL